MEDYLSETFGQRAACYSADLLLRQYKRVRDTKGKKFTYKDVQPVYTIVIFEKSPKEFHRFPDEYLHYVEAKANTGLEVDFKPMYEDVYQLCLNTEKVMGMFSKELQILDENTVQYMIDEQQAIIDDQKETIAEQKGTIAEQKDTIDNLQGRLETKESYLKEKDEQIRRLQEQLKKAGIQL